MNSILANLFLLLQAKFDTIMNGDAKAFRYSDHDMGQLQDETPALSYPAILIDFEDITWSDIGENCKIGEGPIKLSLVFDPYSGTSNITNPVYKQKGLGFLESEKLLTDALHGWNPDETTDVYSPLDFVSARTNKSRTDLRIREVTFNISLDDYSNATPLTYTPVSPAITPVFIGMPNGIHINVPGTGYALNDQVYITGGDGQAVVVILGVDEEGAVTYITWYATGANYTTGISIATTGGTGTAFTVDITSLR